MFGEDWKETNASAIEENIKDAWSCRVSGLLRQAREGEEEGSGKVMGWGGRLVDGEVEEVEEEEHSQGRNLHSEAQMDAKQLLNSCKVEQLLGRRGKRSGGDEGMRDEERERERETERDGEAQGTC